MVIIRNVQFKRDKKNAFVEYYASKMFPEIFFIVIVDQFNIFGGGGGELSNVDSHQTEII